MSSCPDCSPLDRRQFLKTAAAATAGALAVTAAPKLRGDSETLVTTLYKSLTPEQRAKICFAFDHELRSKVDANWQITEARVGKAFTPDQQAMIEEIFRGLHNPEFYDKVVYHMKEDGGGLGAYSVAVFGEPGPGKFEFVLTGRHCTARCDGDSVEGAAFGGPIFYGHASQSFNEPPDHPGNAYWYQAKRANQVFQMLDGKQRQLALLDEPREEKGTETVKLTGKSTGLPGIPMSALSHDQKDLVRKVMADVLAPFRKSDTEEAMKLIQKNGFDHLHMSFYKNEDIGHDGVWDIWQIEGPAMLWFFRGAPHVHPWVH